MTFTESDASERFLALDQNAVFAKCCLNKLIYKHDYFRSTKIRLQDKTVKVELSTNINDTN